MSEVNQLSAAGRGPAGSAALGAPRPRIAAAWAGTLGAALAAAAIGLLWRAAGALPAPRQVLSALAALWTERGLADQLAASLALNAEAIAWSAALSLGLAYLTVLPALRPLVGAVSKLRFTGLVGWGFVLTLWARDGHQLKLWMLVFGMVPFAATSMAAVVASIPRERLDHARAMRMGRARVVWEVVVRGTLDQALEVIRQNAAIGWMMLTMVEGVVRAEGGIGTLMLDEQKHLRLDAVFALIGVVLAVGALQDHALAWLRRAACPFADERREP
jgi:NitT/TauT family transport system permease protein